jgi:membrane-associated phospholipid phosphatase
MNYFTQTEPRPIKMIYRKKPGYYAVIITIITLIAVLVSIRFLDRGIAVRVMRFLQSIRSLHNATAEIPDILPHLVSAGTVLMWFLYFYLSKKKISDIKIKFLRLAATALPVAYLVKTFLQYGFGRTSARLWLTTHEPLKFTFFREFGFGCFPSGHMTAFTAFGTAVWLFYPRYRRHVGIMLALLAGALITTDYHFLSDVIAGAYLGVLITCIIKYLLDRSTRSTVN